MARLLIAALLALIIGVAGGYMFAHHSQKRLRDESNLTLSLHREFDIASITGKELAYLQDQQDSKASLLCDNISVMLCNTLMNL